MKHTWYECNCTRRYCPYCVGGLGACAVCDGAEGTLTTECCGKKMRPEAQELVYRGWLDYRGGAWLLERPMIPLEEWLGLVSFCIDCKGSGEGLGEGGCTSCGGLGELSGDPLDIQAPHLPWYRSLNGYNKVYATLREALADNPNLLEACTPRGASWEIVIDVCAPPW